MRSSIRQTLFTVVRGKPQNTPKQKSTVDKIKLPLPPPQEASPSPDGLVRVARVVERDEPEGRGSLWHLELHVRDLSVFVEYVLQIFLLHVHGQVADVHARHV